MLKNGKSDKEIKKLGDVFHLQNYFSDRDYNDVRQLFGQEFATAIFSIQKEGWTSPISSGYGIHLVNITAIQTESIKPFDKVKDKILADWKINQQQLYNERLYANLLKKYEVEYDLSKWEGE